MSEVETVSSPCISVCALDENDICLGCFRTAQEITDWSVLNNEDKRSVVQQANARRKEHFGGLL